MARSSACWTAFNSPSPLGLLSHHKNTDHHTGRPLSSTLRSQRDLAPIKRGILGLGQSTFGPVQGPELGLPVTLLTPFPNSSWNPSRPNRTTIAGNLCSTLEQPVEKSCLCYFKERASGEAGLISQAKLSWAIVQERMREVRVEWSLQFKVFKTKNIDIRPFGTVQSTTYTGIPVLALHWSYWCNIDPQFNSY